MITPLDIHNKVFDNTVFGGYSKDDVDGFLDRVSEDYEKLYKENIELKDKVNVLGEGIQQHKSMEETIQNTLVIAQNTAEEIKKNAYAKGDNIIKEAELRASKIIGDATEQVLRLRKELEEAKRNYTIFKSRMESLLNTQLEVMRTNFNEEFGEEE